MTRHAPGPLGTTLRSGMFGLQSRDLRGRIGEGLEIATVIAGEDQHGMTGTDPWG